MKRIFAFVLAVALLSSVALAQSADNQPQTSIALPEPAAIPSEQIIGDYSEALTEEVTLYYPSDDVSSLTTLTRSIQADRGVQMISAVVHDLLSPAIQSGNLRHWSPDVQLIHTEYACGSVTVVLSLDAALHQDDFNHLLLCRSIANTLLDMDGVESVNILTADRSELLCGLPSGVFVQKSDHPGTDYALLQSEKSRFIEEENGSIVRNVLLYYPSRNNRYLLPEVCTISFDDRDYLSGLISALKAGPKDGTCVFSVVPPNLSVLRDEPQMVINDAGQRIAVLDLSGTLLNYLAFSGAEPWQLYGSIVLSVSSFVPEIDGLQIYVDGNMISSCQINGRYVEFPDSIMRRSDYDHLIGSRAPQYFVNPEGNLCQSWNAVSQSEAVSARSILREMIAAGIPDEEGLASVFPENIMPGDILGVRVEGGVADVNLSAGFYSSCQSLNAEEERNLIYAMVNALCKLEQVGSVRFRVEGESVESLAQNIYLKSALLPNPGLEAK